MYACMYVRVCRYVQVRMYVSMYVLLVHLRVIHLCETYYVCLYECMYVCRYVCMCVCVHEAIIKSIHEFVPFHNGPRQTSGARGRPPWARGGQDNLGNGHPQIPDKAPAY